MFLIIIIIIIFINCNLAVTQFQVKIEKICLGLNDSSILIRTLSFTSTFRKPVLHRVSIEGYIISMQTKFYYTEKFLRLFVKVTFHVC